MSRLGRCGRCFTVVLLFAVAGCRAPAPRHHAGTPEDPWIIGMSQCNLGEPWRVQMNADVKAAADAHPNLRVIYKDAQNNSLTQRAQVEELVEQGADLIIISPKEAAPLTGPVADAYQRGIRSSCSTARSRAISTRLSSGPTT